MSTQIAFVGCSHIHVPGFVNMLKKIKGVSVKYAWDPEIERSTKWGKEAGAEVVTDLNVILKDPDIKAVVITSKTIEHADLVKKFAKAGKHIFVEKPLGMSAADARKQANLINKAGVMFSTGYFMRSFSINQYVRKMIQSGKLGKISRISLSNCHSGSLGGWFDTEWRWMTDPKEAGCGAFGDLGTHILDILLWFMEGDQVQRVTGAVDSATGRYGKVDEYGQGLIQFKSGAIANIAAGWVSNADPYKLDVSGTEGELYVEGGKLYHKPKGKDAKEVTKLPKALPHAFMIFIEQVAGKSKRPMVAADEAALRNSVMEKIYQGACEGTWVKA